MSHEIAKRHPTQQEIWEGLHKNEGMPQIDGEEMSSAVQKFVIWLIENGIEPKNGIDMCCGKGRNAIGLAKLGIQMTGIDFSKFAIETARERRRKHGLTADQVIFYEQDATQDWPYPEGDHFDFGLDCFATADIRGEELRQEAVNNLIDSIKPGGCVLVYTLSDQDDYSKFMMKVRKVHTEPRAYLTHNGKFEKCFNESEVRKLYRGLIFRAHDRIVKITKYPDLPTVFNCYHHWFVLQKPE